MAPLKNIFTGHEKPPHPRATSSQKCMRAGGKHNDLDNVGYTARHHTFFEMLGNFSFGDYFKEEAIVFAWELVTKELGIAADRLWATVYVEDDEADNLWRKILPASRVIRISGSDNFWSMGETGPCGPCSELFYDHGEKIPGKPPGSGAEGDRFVEIWNLVFMQFEQKDPQTRVPLPAPCIDTGMGLERLAAVLQGTYDNYETDLFKTLTQACAELTGDKPQDAACRVIADHLRAAGFLIADGILPSNEGRGYVLRRILRRAVRHAPGVQEPLLHRLAPVLVREMGKPYSELKRAQALIVSTLEDEETRFRETLQRGLHLLEDATKGLAAGGELSGQVVFRLYDTYGFPVDLTEDVLRPRGIRVDMAAFEAAMDEQRATARAHWSGSGETIPDRLWRDLSQNISSTFLGYETDTAQEKVVALVDQGSSVQSLAAGAQAYVVVSRTPFYPESGGQIGDTGLLTGAQSRFVVEDTQRQNGLIYHKGTLQEGALQVGDTVTLAVDTKRRNRTRRNHSATHLLHQALREVLGPHVTQKGSYVGPDRLRFDFSHPKPMTQGEIDAVENLVNERVCQNEDVVVRSMKYDDAIQAGALALFGEKYDDEVRVLFMGEGDGARHGWSVELCGGTHVRRLGDIALFKIVREGGVAAGVRRIEALTAQQARSYLNDQERLLGASAALLKTPPEGLPEKLTALLEERKSLKAERDQLRQKIALGGSQSAEGGDTEKLGTLTLMMRRLEGVPPRELPALVDQAKQSLGSGIVALVTVNEGKAGLVVGITPDLTQDYDAVTLARAGAVVLGGKGGGGRRDFAQAGGPLGARAQDALAAVRQRLSESTV